MKTEIYEKISGEIPELIITKDEKMSRHTTFRCGGPADYFVQIRNNEILEKLLKLLHEEGAEFYRDFFVVGNGSNLLVSDDGYRGMVISLEGDFKQIEMVDDIRIRAGSGAANSMVANLARDKGLTGFEFAHGIPGTIGGALIMNAGAYGGEMKQVVESVRGIDEEGNLRTYSNEEAEFGYRTSAFKGKPLILTETVIKLRRGDRELISQTMTELMNKRREKQPLEYPSAGSTFKRPEGYFAGKLIEDAGLRGFSIGGAQVSEKHCGFVINKGEATSSDVDALIKAIQEKVLDDSGVMLSPEVIRLGDFR